MRFAIRVAVLMLMASAAGWTAQVSSERDTKEFAGTWILRIGERNLFVLTLTPEGTNMHGIMERPTKFDSNNGAFANMRDGVRSDSVVVARKKEGALHFTTRNPNDAKDEDGFVMTLKGDQAQLTFDDLPRGTVVEPYVLQRGAAGAKVATDWEPNRLYLQGDSSESSDAMKTIYAEDQRVRTTETIDWTVVSKSDADRRVQTRKLLADGALHTGKDYEQAAFVFQHGDVPQDYLLAHTLAMVAVSKGDATAIWIAAATLDRYLEKIKQKQIFGTQFSSGPQNFWTQEPYDRELVSDSLRRQLAVPSQATQAEQLKAYQEKK
jgi:hypothetical protein